MADTAVQGNPPTRDILNNHELAWRTINQHNTELSIFDQSELAKLKRFVMDPSPETRQAIIEEYGAVEPDDTPEDDIGQRAAQKGSLAVYVIARYGKVTNEKRTLKASEIEALKEWFERGGDQVD